MTTTTAPGRDPSTPGPGAARGGWWAPALQFVTLVAVIVTGATQIGAARADIAADSGRGPVVAVSPVASRVAPPVSITIPRLRLMDRLIGLRKNRDGTLQVPGNPQQPGWYSEGAAPGDPGPAVIVGHVDSYRGPGVFAKINTLQRGDLINVRRADGSLVAFQVRLVRTYAKRSFPTSLVYVGDGHPSLRLITCGGAFDDVSRHYLSDTVVFAALYTPRLRPRT
ncbi:MAG: hypothetical protein NVS3B26_21990 [Mycobacteriales bacterium]